MTNRDNFFLVAKRIKERAKKDGIVYEPYKMNQHGEITNEYTINERDYWLTYQNSKSESFLWFLKETEVCDDGSYIDAVSEYFYPESFDLKEFLLYATAFYLMFEDLYEESE